jgi:type II secretory pathway component PulM
MSRIRLFVQGVWRARTANERRLIAVAALIAATYGWVAFAVDPLLSRRESVERQIVLREQSLDEVIVLGNRFRAAREQAARVESSLLPKNEPAAVFAYLERAAASAGVSKQIHITQAEGPPGSGPFTGRAFDVRLTSVPFSRLSAFQVEIEQAPFLLHTKRLTILPRPDAPGLFHAAYAFVTYERG